MRIRASKYLLLVAIIASSPIQSYAQEKLERSTEPPPTWTQFVSEEGRFRVLMPDKPKLEVLTYESGKNSLVHNTFTVEKGAFTWLVDYADLPPESVDSTNLTTFFNEARDELLRGVNGTLQQQKPLTLEGHPGLEMILHIYGGVARVRFYLANNRLYQLLVTRLDILSKSDESMEKFLNSFKIVDEQAPPTTILRAGVVGTLHTA